MNGDIARGGASFGGWLQPAIGRWVRNDMSGSVAGPVVQAQMIGEVTIEAPPPPISIPRQLPPTPPQFVNRLRELERMNRLISERSNAARPAVAVLSGMTGVGKSAIGIHWAHLHRDRFTGGQLFADLAAYRHRGAVAVSDVLGGFLRALGVHEQFIPVALPERAAMFRSRTAMAPVLVFVDDADQAAQVRPLLPGSAESVVIVTSRRRLSGLALEAAELIELQPLDSSDGTSLVAQMLPASQVCTERQALSDLVRLCAGLPIALRVAGARLTSRRQWSISRLVHHLADDAQRLNRLSLSGEPGIAEIFDVAYEDLPGAARRLYRCLGLHPGQEFGLPLVATAVQVSLAKADESLEILRDANLVEDSGVDRYRLHELVWLHAQRRAEHDQKTAARERVLKRIVNWYLLGAATADRAVLGSERWRLARHDTAQWTIAFDPATAMDWFETERMNLLGVVRTAARCNWHELVWQLCEALWALYYGRKHYADWIETHELAVKAAVKAGNRLAEARMYNQLARAHLEIAEFNLAHDELAAALAAAGASGEPRARAVVFESFGVLYREQGRFADALEAFRQAHMINAEVNDPRGVAIEAYHIGDVLGRCGRPDAALAALAEALEIFDQIGDEMAAGRARIALGSAYRALGHPDAAQASLLSACTTMRERKQSVKEAQALEVLAELALDTGDTDLFHTAADRLLEIYRETGSTRVTVVQRWLDDHPRSAT